MKKFKIWTKRSFEKVKRVLVGAAATLSMTSVMAIPAMAATDFNTPDDPTSLIGGILDVIFKIAQWFGIVIAVIGLFMFLYSFKDENAEAQGRGVKLAIVGMALIGLRFIVKMTGLIS